MTANEDINNARTAEEFCDAASDLRARIKRGEREDVQSDMIHLAYKGHHLIARIGATPTFRANAAAATKQIWEMTRISQAVVETLATEPPG